MNTYSYESLCKDLEAGGKHEVVNEDTKVIGDVQMCNHGFFNVHVGHGEEVWASEKCREISPDEEWKYRKGHNE